MQYFLRCPFSQARMIQVADEGRVIYKTGDLPAPRLRQAGNRLGRFPDDLVAGPKRNFQIFDPVDFLAEVTQHPRSPWRAMVGRHPGEGCRNQRQWSVVSGQQGEGTWGQAGPQTMGLSACGHAQAGHFDQAGL